MRTGRFTGVGERFSHYASQFAGERSSWPSGRRQPRAAGSATSFAHSARTAIVVNRICANVLVETAVSLLTGDEDFDQADPVFRA
jgi:hypothetical protein